MGRQIERVFILPLIACLSLIGGVRVKGQAFTNLYSFRSQYGALGTNTDGASPQAGLILSGNTFYGTTVFGGNSGNGTVFAINSDGTGFTNLHNFTATSGTYNTNSDGANPYAALTITSNILYGTARNGGGGGNGTVFTLHTDGTGFTNLYSYTATTNGINADGANPEGVLVFSNHTLFGTTVFGGSSGNGTVFALNDDGSFFTNFHSFTSTSGAGRTNTDGANPFGGLILSGITLYGTTRSGGTSGHGTVFALITFRTTFTNLHSFSRVFSQFLMNSDGANPTGVLLLSGKTLFGTASNGGGFGEGAVFKVNTDGTGFTNLHSFTGTFLNGSIPFPDSNGGFPVGGLAISNNTLFGVTQEGGINNYPTYVGGGTMYALNTDGTGFTTLYRFTHISTNSPNTNYDGAFPSAGLILSSNIVYGTARGGGSWGSGAIFSLALALRPPPPLLPKISADFTTATIQTNNMTITPGAYFTYNAIAGGSWGIAAESFGFLGTFVVPATGSYRLTVDHQTSAASTCPGGGYSPVDIYVNGTQIASNFDPAQQNGGSLAEVTNSWVVNALAGENTLQWIAGPLCSRYWIQGIQVSSAPPVLNWSTAPNNLTLYWGTNLAGFVLESTTSVTGVWSQVSTARTVFNGLNFVTNSFAAPLQLYRLRSTNGQ